MSLLAMLVSGCTGSDDASRPSTASSAAARSSSGTDSSAPSATASGAAAGGGDPAAVRPEVTTESVLADLASVGIAVVDPETGDPVQPVSGTPSPVSFGSGQLPTTVAAIRTGTGLSAGQLDSLAHWPELDGPVPQLTPSLLLAGWLVGADSPASELARTWMGGQDPTRYDELVYPSAVLDLFLSDLLPRAGGAPGSAIASPAAYVAARSGDQSICEQFQGFIEGAIVKVFDAIGRLPNVSGDSIWVKIANGLIDVLNLGKDALQFLVVNGTKVFLKPVVDAVAKVASVVALATNAVKLLLPWSGEILPDPTGPTLGTAPVDGVWTLRLRSPGPQEWPTQVVGCANWARVTLPSLRPSEADVSWRITSQSPRPLLSTGAATRKVASDGTATLKWQTLVEPPDVAAGREQYDGAVYVRATVTRTDVDKFYAAMFRAFLGLVPVWLPPAIPAIVVNQLMPTITRALKSLTKLRSLSVVGYLYPIYHQKEETPTPTPTASPRKTFCQGFTAMLVWRETHGGSTGGAPNRPVAAKQAAMLRQILPLGTTRQARDGAVLAKIWKMFSQYDQSSPTRNLGVIGGEMVRLGYYDAVLRIAASCRIDPNRIGAG